MFKNRDKQAIFGALTETPFLPQREATAKVKSDSHRKCRHPSFKSQTGHGDLGSLPLSVPTLVWDTWVCLQDILC